MSAVDLSSNILVFIFGYFCILAPLITWFYLDKKYSKLKNNFLYNTTGPVLTRQKVFHRFLGYTTIFVFNDKSKLNNRNRLSHYLAPSTDINKLVKIGRKERYFGIFNISLIFILTVDLAVYYVLSGGWPFNYLYGTEGGPTTELQIYNLSGAVVILVAAIVYYSFRFIKKRKTKKN